MSMSQRIYFFASRSAAGHVAFGTVSALYPEHVWKLFTIEDSEEAARFEAEQHQVDLIISFLNPYIVPVWLLDSVSGRAFNVHPATPEYPGSDPQHFAFYEGASTVGATLHHMECKVDSGRIIDVVEEKTDRSRGVMHFVDRSEAMSLVLLLRHLPALLDGTVKPVVKRTWRREAKRTRQDFLRMCRLDPLMDADEVRNRIEAFFNPQYRSIYLELHGHRFVYEPSSPPPSELGGTERKEPAGGADRQERPLDLDH